MSRPKPSQVFTNLKGAMPFTDCFGRAEREIMAALYVEACKERGDTWLRLMPRDIGDMMMQLANPKRDPIYHRVIEKPPTWILAIQYLNLTPDMPGLVKEGFFTMTDDNSVEPTDKFFEAVKPYTRAA
jgi:hypothetical protein